jgi:ABC-type antimicrobial peptide transport system permease subunit
MVPPRWSLAIRVRPASGIGSLSPRIINWIQPIDPQLYWQVGGMEQLILVSESLTMRRPIISLVAAFGGLALVLVVVGVFGVASYSVAERTREIGIRLSLGASHREIAALVLHEALKVTLAGLALGTFCSFAVTRFFPTEGIGWSGSGIFPYHVSGTDGLTYSLPAGFWQSWC